MANTVMWFDIPVSDMQRASKFYGAIFETTLEAGPAAPGFEMAMFPNQGGVNGALVYGESYKPSHLGSLVYLNAGDDLSHVLNRVEKAGGKVLQAKTSLGENGFMAYIEDTEGNKVGLHSVK